MPYQSLHSPSKFRCLRKKNCCDCDWFLQWKNFPPTLCLAGEMTSVDAGSAPPSSLTSVSEIVFPFEGLELSRLKNIFFLYISLYLLWKPDSGISIHVLCFNVCVLCFNVKYENKAFTICFSFWCRVSWMLEAGTCVPFEKGSNPRLPRRFLHFGSTGSELDRMVPGSKVNILFKLMK